ncbi:S-crystallin [Parasponia andersonii]|uniref:Glutathione S-transferase n=1 Tax=Parasponia andersonii TaxID=3476 RepID=A0A2P5D2E7_PARAD|nr:S-crystallin [Parasponia andersonii]
MVQSDVRLLGMWASPFVLRVRIALNLKQVQYEFVEETVGVKSELLLKSNPVHKKVPVLLHGGKSISESLIIIQYIDNAWASSGPSILPSDPYDRASHQFWAAYVDDKHCWDNTGRGEGRMVGIDPYTSYVLLKEEIFHISYKLVVFEIKIRIFAWRIRNHKFYE